MADENKRPDSTPEITSLSDEETITEIDLGSFLADKDSKEVLYDGFHDDIQNTEKSLEDELQSLYDDIMSKGPVTIVPKKLEDLTAAEEKKASPFDDMWMSPEEYMEIPDVPAAKEDAAMKADASPETDRSKDDIFGMIESLKESTDTEKGFDAILSSIEANANITPVNTDLAKTEELTKDYVPAPEASAAPAAPQKAAKPAGGIDTDSPEFADELAVLLGDKPAPAAEPAPQEPAKQEPAPAAEDVPFVKAKPEFVVTIPDDDEVTVLPEDAPAYDSLIKNERTIGYVNPDEVEEFDGKVSRKERKKAKKEAEAYAKGKDLDGEEPKSAGDIVRKVILSISIVVIIVSCGILAKTYLYEPYMYRKNASEITDSLDTEVTGTVEDSSSSENSEYPAGMLAKYTQLYDINSDLRGWISIPGLDINLPIAQSDDNDYYLHRNIYKKSTNYGVPFFDYRITDFVNLPKNTVVYGHNMHYDDYIFGLLENYRDIEGFQQNPVIECNTIYGDFKWKVYAVFITNSEESQDNGYLFPYNFIDISNERFAEYIQEIDKRKFYTTGVDINEEDKILTLSTCCYDFTGGRLVVVARMVRDGEDTYVDTSLAVKNENPKYPQAWYDAMKKTNPYADDARW